MRVSWSEVMKRGKRPAATLAVGLTILGAHWLGGWRAEASMERDAPVEAPAPEEKKVETPEADDEPMKVMVPRSGSGARSSGIGGESWMSGDPGRLGDGFKKAVSSQFGDGTLGQAQRAMAGMGFQCAMGRGGRLECAKTLVADNCTMTWSVRLNAVGGDVTGAGGEGFSRECS